VQIFLLDSDFKPLSESFYDLSRLGRLVHSSVVAFGDAQQLAADFSLPQHEEIEFDRYIASVEQLEIENETVRDAYHTCHSETNDIER
jgi:hypothetical protein